MEESQTSSELKSSSTSTTTGVTDAREDSDINSERSKKDGVAGLIENLFRQFKNIFFLPFLLPIAG